MAFNPKPLLKGFGTGADVAGQIATDKAVNSRRTRSGFYQFDITQGQLIENATVPADGNVAHSLGRVPKGAIVLWASEPVTLTSKTSSTITIDPALAEVTLWVV